ncbi:MAG: branched-chain amino acid ABC transporter permease [Planctomycetota bacterium]|nr:branched-chain amino acid ABC transporter permease [Planctomycetota bacterium]
MLWQLTVNGIIAGAVYALVGVGFALIYNVARFFNFAHGVVFTLGAYIAFLFTSVVQLPLLLALPMAVLLTALIGCGLDLVVFAPLRRKSSAPLVLLLSSLGIYIVLQNLISIAFGDDIKTIRSGGVGQRIALLGAQVTSTQIVIVLTSALVLVALIVFLRATKIGEAIRAVSSDPELAKVCGIESDRVVLCTFGIGSALAAIAGILVAFDVDLTPTMGLNALMMGIVAVIIGGIGSVPGVALGALLLGLAQHLGVWKISSQWQDAIAFVILLAFLLVRPEGFLGKSVGKARV